jgi:exopolysaccharide biosynthesis polyprenyl glycosylphosphotransferase
LAGVRAHTRTDPETDASVARFEFKAWAVSRTLPRAVPAPAGTARKHPIKRRWLLAPVTESGATAVVLKRASTYRCLLALGDVVAAMVAIGVALRAGAGAPLTPWLVLVLPALVLTAKVSGLYDRDELILRKTTLDEAPGLFHVATLFTLAIWGLGRALAGSPINPTDALVLWIALFVMLVVARKCARSLARAMTPEERCLFVGDREAQRRFRAKLEHGRGVKARMVAQMDLAAILPFATATPASPDVAELRALLRQMDVHRVVVAPETPTANETADLIRTLKLAGIHVSVVPSLFDVVGSSVEFDDLHGMMVLGVRRFELTRSSRIIKRSFDLLGAALGLVVAGPAMALIALLIKLDSPGAVLFHQERVGRDGRPFQMLKFRTMVVGADARKLQLAALNDGAEGFFKITKDPRTTGLGYFLRRSSLDELPQLINVLRGEMSLVGPRPLIHEEDELISGWHRRRLALTPGMTGYWQILGSSRVPLHEMVVIDYLYVTNWSLWNDVKILVRTVPYVLGRQSR